MYIRSSMPYPEQPSSNDEDRGDTNSRGSAGAGQVLPHSGVLESARTILPRLHRTCGGRTGCNRLDGTVARPRTRRWWQKARDGIGGDAGSDCWLVHPGRSAQLPCRGPHDTRRQAWFFGTDVGTARPSATSRSKNRRESLVGLPEPAHRTSPMTSCAPAAPLTQFHRRGGHRFTAQPPRTALPLSSPLH